MVGDIARNRADVDDRPSRRLGCHLADRSTTAVEDAADVDVHHEVIVVVGRVLDRFLDLHPGVVDDRVETTGGADRSSDQGIARCCVGDIGLDPRDAVEGDRATAGGEDGGALGDEPGGDPLTDPARCAGDDRGEPGESAGHVTSPNAIDSQS